MRVSWDAKRPGDLAGIARGDTVVYVDEAGQARRKLAESAGPVWIKVGGVRFERETGNNEFGVARPYICTTDAWAVFEECQKLCAQLRPWGLIPRGELSLLRLRQLADLVARWERADSPDLPEHLRDCSFQRAGALVLDDERPMAARERGKAAETADEAAWALREGQVSEACNLLESALAFLVKYQIRVRP
jgi:hypothetical protein